MDEIPADQQVSVSKRQGFETLTGEATCTCSPHGGGNHVAVLAECLIAEGVMIRSLQSPNICCSFDAEFSSRRQDSWYRFTGSESVYVLNPYVTEKWPTAE